MPKGIPDHGRLGRRFTEHFPAGLGRGKVLAADNSAVIDGRTVFWSRIRGSAAQDRLLKSGKHNRKIGSHVIKGRWTGAQLYTLTLEERFTCPRDCIQWRNCYANGMPWPIRIRPDEGLMPRLAEELRQLCKKHHRHGILVRLHVLGDFYSVDYVRFWNVMIMMLPKLHVFGFTARHVGPIAAAIKDLNRHPRCSIRTSNGAAGSFRSVVIEKPADAPIGAIVCPAQTDTAEKPRACGSCALCWTTPKTIAFLRH